MGNLRKLKELNLSENELSGSIPSSFNNFRSVMKRMYLLRNQLSGSIPLYLLNFTELDSLYLSANSFTGCKPNGLRRAVANNDIGNISLELCANTLTSTPVPTNTSTPDGDARSFDADGDTRARLLPTFTLTYKPPEHNQCGITRAQADVTRRPGYFWRRVGQSSYQQQCLAVWHIHPAGRGLGLTVSPVYSPMLPTKSICKPMTPIIWRWAARA